MSGLPSSPSIHCVHTRDEAPDQASFHMHAHDAYEVLLFLSGHGSYLVESTEYPLQAGCVLLMRPGEVHCLHIDADAPYERMVLQFQREALEGEWLIPFDCRPLGSGNAYAPQEIDTAFVQACMRRLCADNAALPPYRAVLLTALLSEFCRAFHERLPSPADAESEPPSRLREILQYINAHLDEELSLDSLCSRFYISRAQLGRLFRAATGSGIWEYISIKRLIEARRRILSGQPVIEAAHACGFQDYSAFYRAYKKRYRCSPTDDRQKYSE